MVVAEAQQHDWIEYLNSCKNMSSWHGVGANLAEGERELGWDVVLFVLINIVSGLDLFVCFDTVSGLDLFCCISLSFCGLVRISF